MKRLFSNFCFVMATFFATQSHAQSPEQSTFQRKHLHIVGSSTVYPFTATIAETFGRDSNFKTPIVEATGTGGGFKLFCSGIGGNFPDFINASRAIEESEIARCTQHHITKPVEIKIGYDGIVLANSNAGKKYSLTKKQIFLAVSKQVPDVKTGKLMDNPYRKWSDIDRNLPGYDIVIYGPPSTSGTRDSFAELAMERICISMPEFIRTYPEIKLRKKHCRSVRSDGAFIEAGENDNLIVQKLRNDAHALGIFGFSFLEENRHLVQPVTVDNIMPSFEAIMSLHYSFSRPLFIYFKKEHVVLASGMPEFIAEIISKNTLGKEGYLLQKGLVPLKDDELKAVQKQVNAALESK